MESKLEGTFNYLQFVDCILDAARGSLFRPAYILKLKKTFNDDKKNKH